MIKVVRDPEIVAAYSRDALGIAGGFEGVCRPKTEAEVAELVQRCLRDRMPMTPQGLRSSLTGASMCDHGLALSTERMNRIVDVDAKRSIAVVEPGVVVSDLKDAAAREGLFYPPDPTSYRECTIGGNVATNASGASGLRYGATMDWVCGLHVVDGRGRRLDIRNGEADKSCAGYGALQRPVRLFIGSEGTLGIVTRIEVRLCPPPPDHFLGIAYLSDLHRMLDLVITVRKDTAFSPRTIEFLDSTCLDIIRPLAEGVSIPEQAACMLYFEQEYQDETDREYRLSQWLNIIEEHSPFADDTQVAMTSKQKRHIRDLRHRVPETLNEAGARAVASGGGKISTDWAVPCHRLHELFAAFDEIRGDLGDMPVAAFAHIGEGHPHFNFIARNASEKAAAERVDAFMARKAVELGGVVAGEHGIGKLKREHMAFQYPRPILDAMRAVKRELDPEGILAPGNIFP